MNRLVPELFDTNPILYLSTFKQIAQLMCPAFFLGLVADEKVELGVVSQISIDSTLLKT